MAFANRFLWFDPDQQKKDGMYHVAEVDGKEVYSTFSAEQNCPPSNDNSKLKFLGVGNFLRKQAYKTIFIPLIAEYFFAFKNGTKTAEYRRPEGQFSPENCTVGKRVNLRRGYSTNDNLYGTVKSYRILKKSQFMGPLRKSMDKLYGKQDEDIAEIGIELD